MDGDPCLPPGLVIGLALPLQVQGPEPQVHVLRPLPVPPPPGLAGQCGDSGVQVGVVPLEGQLERRSVPLQAGDGGVVTVAQAVPLLRRDALDPRQSLPDGGAVAEYSHRLAGVLYGDAPDGALHPGPDLPQALAAGGDPRGVAVVELEEPLPLRPAHLAPGTVLPAAHVDLPQAGICVQLQSLGHIDGPGGGPGAVQVAGPDRIHRHAGKPRLQGLDLLPAVLRDQGVIPAVDPAVEVPLRLRVADQIDRCHNTTPLFLTRGAPLRSAPGRQTAPGGRQWPPSRPVP